MDAFNTRGFQTSMDSGERSRQPKVGLVLSGGGARAALATVPQAAAPQPAAPLVRDRAVGAPCLAPVHDRGRQAVEVKTLAADVEQFHQMTSIRAPRGGPGMSVRRR